MTLRRLDHAQVTVPRNCEAAARGFYLDLLGLQEMPKPAALAAKGGFWCALGSVQIHVSLEDGVDRLRTRAHLAYEVSDLEGWRMRLTAAGFALEDAAPLPGIARFELRDPFGNRLELLQCMA